MTSFQLFCNCGKGRCFMMSSYRGKAKLAAMKAEWTADLARDGWTEVDLDRGRAATCNICNRQPVPEGQDGPYLTRGWRTEAAQAEAESAE